MNINTFITCTSYLSAEWLPPSESLWLGGSFTVAVADLEISICFIWTLKGGYWGASIDLIGYYLFW